MTGIAATNNEDVQSVVEGRISKTMVGRGPETELFKKQFDRVLEGRMGLTVVSGAPGVGKTFFVEQAVGLLSGAGATYVHGKFRQYDGKALAAFSEIIEQSVKHILALPTESLNRIKSNLKQKLGPDAAIIVSLCPFAQILLDTHKSISSDNLEQIKYRVRNAVYQFLANVSTATFPLIVFIDDLQWADALSVNIVETVCQDLDSLNVHLVLAWRNDDDIAVKLNTARLSKHDDVVVRLEGLEYEDVDRYVRLVFGEDIEDKDYLIRMLYGLTLGNPFNMNRVLKLFLKENVIKYSVPKEKWTPSISSMARLDLPADIEMLLGRQIDGLEREEKEILQLVACCGETSFGFLTTLTGFDKEVLDARLHRLCANAMLVRIVRRNFLRSNLPEGDLPENDLTQSEVCYGLIHDIVLKIAYNSLTPEERAKIHYHIAITLSELEDRSYTVDDRLMMASHLLRAGTLLLAQDRSGQWIGELYEAGLAAKRTAAMEQAVVILERCVELLETYELRGIELDCCALRENGLALSVHLELAECQFICECVEEAKIKFDFLLKNHPETADQIKIKRSYINLCACNGDFEQVMELGHQILSHVGFTVESKYFWLDLLKSRLLIGDRKIRQLESVPAITDEKQLCILETLTVMVLAANRISDELSAVYAVKLATVSARYGNSDYAPTAYAAYCYVLFHALRDHKTGRRLQAAVLSLIEKCPNHDSKSTALFILGTFTRHWTDTLEASVSCLERSIAEGEKEGASLYGSYSIAFTVITRYMMGKPLGELEQYIANCRKRPKRLEHYIALSIWDIYEDHIARLRRGSRTDGTALPADREMPPSDGEENVEKQLFADTMKLTGDIMKLERLYLERETEEGYRLTMDLAPIMTSIQGFILDVHYSFYDALTRLAMHPRLFGAEQRRNRKAIRKQLRELKYCVRVFKENHYARYLLVRAECDVVLGRGRSSERLCQEAMEFAERQSDLPLEALANLFAAKYRRENRKLSRFYTAEAVNLYRKWGAAHIADLVAGEVGLALSEGTAPTVTVPMVTAPTEPVPGEPALPSGIWVAAAPKGAVADFPLHLSKMGELDEDGKYLYLLDLLVGSGDADYCAVFFEKSDEMYLKYEKRMGGNSRLYKEAINMSHMGGLPHRIIRYVARTGTEVLMDAGDQTELFANDPFLTDGNGSSLACLPIKFAGVSAGIIYIEKQGAGLDRDNLPPFVRGLLSSISSTNTGINEISRPGVQESKTQKQLFTAREHEIMGLVAAGKSNAEISEQLFITLGTVKNHLRNIYGKLNVDNRVQAVMKAKELKIIEI